MKHSKSVVFCVLVEMGMSGGLACAAIPQERSPEHVLSETEFRELDLNEHKSLQVVALSLAAASALAFFVGLPLMPWLVRR